MEAMFQLPANMFKKNDFVVKSSTNIRHSERKSLFPDPINALYNSKQQFSLVKVALPNGSTQKVFVHDGEPLFFEYTEGRVSALFPSVYFLWMFPENAYFPILYIHASVFAFLQKGSDLMIPGLYLDSSIDDFPEFEQGQPVAISAFCDDEEDGKGEQICFGPMAVGKALMSSREMKERRLGGKKGKAIEILHIFGDSLWAFGSKKEATRKKMADSKINLKEVDLTDFELENSEHAAGTSNGATEIGWPQGDKEINKESEMTNVAENTMEEMENLLKSTFFSALRWKFQGNVEGGHQSELPIDVGQFYANYILKCLSAGKRLDIKKTNTFLREINNECEESVVQIKTIKGIDVIENINFDHPLIQNAPKFNSEDGITLLTSISTAQNSSKFLTIREQLFSVTEQVMPLFRVMGHHKGDLVDLNGIYTILVDYAQKHNLLKDSGKSVELDDQLQMAIKHFLADTFPLNTIVQRLSGAMTNAVVVQTRDGQQFVHRAKLPCVEIKVERRAGNKVVTLVNNLISFGIDAKNVGKEIKGTGTSISQTATACKSPQLLVQGNEVNSIAKILDKLGLPNKFIRGLELGVKEKKNKKK